MASRSASGGPFKSLMKSSRVRYVFLQFSRCNGTLHRPGGLTRISLVPSWSLLHTCRCWADAYFKKENLKDGIWISNDIRCWLSACCIFCIQTAGSTCSCTVSPSLKYFVSSVLQKLKRWSRSDWVIQSTSTASALSRGRNWAFFLNSWYSALQIRRPIWLHRSLASFQISRECKFEKGRFGSSALRQKLLGDSVIRELTSTTCQCHFHWGWGWQITGL